MKCQTAGCEGKVVFEMENETGIIYACVAHQRELLKLLELGILA
jgi:hypothetical protein